MAIEIRKAERKKAKLRLGLAGPSGAGKTMSALKLAHGMGGKICIIDTERGSGDLYSDMFEYSIINLEPPFKPEKYVEAIQAAEAAGFDIIIIDSLSHAWADDGGLLDQADKLSKQSGNRYTVWADLTPQHRKLVNGMLNSTKHIIATVRSKQDYAMEEYTDAKGNKKSKPVKIGMAPVQREGMEYEFTVFLDIDINHNATASKDRTNSFKDEIFMIDEATGQRMMAWLNAGKVDINELKRELVTELNRLHLSPPGEADDRRAFIAEAAAKLTGYELNDENLEQIVAGLRTYTDPETAQKIMFGPKQPPTPPAPEPPQAPPSAPEAQKAPKPQPTTPEPAAATPAAKVEAPGMTEQIQSMFGGEVVPDEAKRESSLAKWKSAATQCKSQRDADDLLEAMKTAGEPGYEIGMIRGILGGKGFIQEKQAAAV